VKRIFKNNGLSIVLALLFLIFWGCQAYSGWHVHTEEALLHQQPTTTFSEYLSTGHFWQATGENWESEFLQMAAYVVLTCFLFQRGSAESKDPDHPEEGHLSPEEKRRYGWLYRNSLTLAFAVLFLAAFFVHAMGGLAEENEMRSEHQLPPETMAGFLTSAEFWFQSFQNWQSEFLAVLAIVVLSIFLRQEGSPESKEVGAPNSESGG
jgi:membrane protein implicated in regulation of membrane protease activity